jgi:hypothetical protein
MVQFSFFFFTCDIQKKKKYSILTFHFEFLHGMKKEKGKV